MDFSITKLHELKGHSGAIYDVFSKDNFIYTAAGDGLVVRWLINEGKQDNFVVKTDGIPYSVSCIQNNNLLLFGLSNGFLHIVDVAKKREIKCFNQHRSAIYRIVENEHFAQFYTSDADGNLGVWSSKDLNLLLFLPFACGKIRDIAVSPNGTKIALACQDGYVRVLETQFFNLLDQFFAHDAGVTSLIWQTEAILFSGGKDAYITKWEWETKKKVKSIPAHNFVVYQLSINSEMLISCSRDKSIKFWDLNSLTPLHKLDVKVGGHFYSVNRLILNNSRLISVSDDKRILIHHISH